MRSLLDKEVVSIDALKDVDVTSTAPSNLDVLQFNSTSGNWEPTTGPGGGSGEVNTGLDISTGTGVAIYDSKAALTLRFRGVGVASNKLTVAYNGSTAEAQYDLGTVSVNDLSDADTTTAAPNINDHLSWDGLNWVPATPASGGATSLDGLTDVDTTTVTPTLGDSLIFDGTNWVPDLSQLAKEVDFNGSIIYVGEAAPGSLVTDLAWRIKEITFTGDDSVTKWANGNTNFSNAWDIHTTHTYL